MSLNQLATIEPDPAFDGKLLGFADLAGDAASEVLVFRHKGEGSAEARFRLTVQTATGAPLWATEGT